MWGRIAFGIICVVILWCLWRRYDAAEVADKAAAAESFAAADLAAYAMRAQPAMATFSNTLQRRMGMGSAGGSTEQFGTNHSVGTFDSYKQNFSSGDVGYGTMMAGFQGPTVLTFGRA